MLVMCSRHVLAWPILLKYIAFEKRFSDHTVKSYQSDLEQFTLYITAQFNTEELNQTTQLMVRSWILSLMDSGLSPRSVNRKIASLRAYFKFALKREEIGKDPMEKVKLLKVQKDLPSFADERQLGIVLDQAVFEDTQDRIIIELLYGTGIRLSELIGLRYSSFNFNDTAIKVLGKRNKERVIPLPKPLAILIKDHIDEKNHENLLDADPYLIVNKSGTKAYPMLVYRVVKNSWMASNRQIKKAHMLCAIVLLPTY